MSNFGEVLKMKECCARVRKSIDRIEEIVGNCTAVPAEFQWMMMENDVHTAYIFSMELAANLQQLMAENAEVNVEQTDGNGQETGLIETEFSPVTGAITVRISAAPPLKRRESASRFLSLISPEISEKVIQILPRNFVRYDAAIVIYVHHFQGESAGKVPYFDNDNVAIKGILDAVVPFVCCDDAYLFCDNIYLSQMDERTFTELIIVRKNDLSRWLHSRPELDFSKGLLCSIDAVEQ